jgi:hypothetical protein
MAPDRNASRSAADSNDRMRGLTARPTVDPDGHRPMALFDSGGRWVAGTAAELPTPLPPMDKPFDFALQRDGKPAPFRGILHQVSSGEIFLVSRDMREINGFRDLLVDAMTSGGGGPRPGG